MSLIVVPGIETLEVVYKLRERGIHTPADLVNKYQELDCGVYPNVDFCHFMLDVFLSTPGATDIGHRVQKVADWAREMINLLFNIRRWCNR